MKGKEKSDAPLVSRREQWAKTWAEEEEGRDPDDYEPEMPPLDCFEYLIGDLFQAGEAGITVAGGMDSGPLTHQAVRAWMQNTGTYRSPWECRWLIRLSHEYVAEMHKATKQGATPPWKAPDVKPEPTAAQLAIRALTNL